MAHQYTCSACGFQVRSDDEDEIVNYVQEHADVRHDLYLPRSQVTTGGGSVSLETTD